MSKTNDIPSEDCLNITKRFIAAREEFNGIQRSMENNPASWEKFLPSLEHAFARLSSINNLFAEHTCKYAEQAKRGTDASKQRIESWIWKIENIPW
ncbi:MAG: hypothetical protein Sylvanvirus11_16 [Sylvanvirus sp.]|uniref:Uncharacterized protein n=1 Tax=Sylvanvirus sp. TaxID=2487774 RepID=A0A3G5AKL6_9VIRU|nr:MAG: hypothetical protein Sylvanvirus11_16 [Sylvanvirus sp.]